MNDAISQCSMAGMFAPTSRLFKVLGLILIALFFYSLARLEFLIWNWSLFKSKDTSDILLSFWVGLRFDLSAMFTLSAPVILWTFIPWSKHWNQFWRLTTIFLFCILQIPFYILNLVDNEFINFVGRRFTFDSLFIVNEVPGKMWNFFISYWHLFTINTLLTLGMAACAVLWMNHEKPIRMQNIEPRWKPWARFAGLAFAILLTTVIAIRGGIQNKPISFVSANVFPAPLLNNLVLNSTFTFIRSYGAQSLKREIFFKEEKEMLGHLNGSLTGSILDGQRPAQKPNIMIIVMESFGAEFIGPNAQGKSYTPFLDSIRAKSQNFEFAYANGRRSIEGIGAIMAGIPALMNEPFISSHFTANYFLGLGTLLDKERYQTSFFHGGRNGTMFFDSFMKSAGVEQYYGATEYGNPKDDDGVWGIWDEPFLNWMSEQLKFAQQPFFTSVFTLTSHQPYKVPPEKVKDYPEGPLPILKTISYTDDALKSFFSKLETQPWFKETIFIFTADHAALHYRPEFDNDFGNYQVPFFIYSPGVKLPRADQKLLVQHIDIMPTILDIIGIQTPEKNFLGSSVFVPGDKVIVNYIDGRYLLFASDYWLQWTRGHGEIEMFENSDREGRFNLTSSAVLQRKEILVQKLKAHIQYFNEGMWDNKLYFPTR